jgi:nucleoside-diphosphate-sugar epimerase
MLSIKLLTIKVFNCFQLGINPIFVKHNFKFMVKDKILVIGASGQIGVELTLALRKIYVMNKEMLHVQVIRQHITQIYLLAAILSATGEKNPNLAWSLNMQGLLHVLDIAREEKLHKVYWPSSIAVFGPTSPKINCPQQTIIEPTTVYGISKYAGEFWCNYYHMKYGVDVRSLRYPGLISYKSAPGGGTTDYAVEIFYEALEEKKYTCFLKEDTYLPMMYMPDAIAATLQLMEAPIEKIKVRTSYNIASMSFSPKEIAAAIKKIIPAFTITYQADYRQSIADSWPQSIDDSAARTDWGWQHQYELAAMTKEMIENVEIKKDKD